MTMTHECCDGSVRKSARDIIVRELVSNLLIHREFMSPFPAKLIIDSTPPADRGAEWNYLMGCLLSYAGQYYDAMRYIEIACYLDPQNEEYREAKMRMQRRSSDYGSVYRTNTDAGECDLCGTCSTLICCDTCCECMGGDLIRCC